MNCYDIQDLGICKGHHFSSRSLSILLAEITEGPHYESLKSIMNQLLILGKMPERTVKDHLQALNNSSAIDPFQSDFRQGYGMELLLLAFVDDLYLNVHKGRPQYFY